VADGKYIFNTLDGQTIALDVKTGKPVWRTQLGNLNKGETMTMAPTVAKGRVYVGNSGGEMGVRGWLIALDESTGKMIWRAYSAGPDADVLIGADFKPHYPSEQGKDLGVSSWPPQAWMIGGGSVWGWVTYDAELDAVYYGVGNPGPWNADQRPGNNQWTRASLRAIPLPGQRAGTTSTRPTTNTTTTASTNKSCSTCRLPERCKRSWCISIAMAMCM
jgi:glucose dehydrogenase